MKNNNRGFINVLRMQTFYFCFVLFLLILEIFNVCGSFSAPLCGNKAFLQKFFQLAAIERQTKNATQVMREEPLSVALVDLNDMLHFVLL